MPSFSPEVARADEASRTVYQAELLRLVEAVADGMPEALDESGRRAAAWTLLAQLAGGVMLARAVPDAALAAEIAAAVRASIKQPAS